MKNWYGLITALWPSLCDAGLGFNVLIVDTSVRSGSERIRSLSTRLPRRSRTMLEIPGQLQWHVPSVRYNLG